MQTKGRRHCSRMSSYALSALAGAALLLVVAACGGGSGPKVDFQVGETQAEPPTALAVQSTEGCRIDADCSEGYFCYQNTCVYECKDDSDCGEGTSCSARGQCTAGGGQGAAAKMQALEGGKPSQALQGLEIVERPETYRSISADAESVTFEWKLSGQSPERGVAYRVERSDGRSDPAQLRYAASGKTFKVELKPGKASPKAEQSGPVSVTIRSALGNLELMMRPEPSWTGTWRGNAEFDSLGGQAIPLEVWLVGESMDDLKVALPVRPGNLFSPREDYDPERRFEVAELKWNPKAKVYQAQFIHEYRFSQGAFAGLPNGQVERKIRFDVKKSVLERGKFHGRMSDTWTGLAEQQNEFGQRSPHKLIQYGDFDVQRAGDLTVDAERLTVRENRGPDPANLPTLDPKACSASNFSDIDPVKDDNGEVKWSCGDIDSVDAFTRRGTTPEEKAKRAAERAECAIAVAVDARSGETTSEQLQAYFAKDSGSSEVPFNEFLEACADDEDPKCQPLEAAPCSMQLLSHASRGLRSQTIEDAEKLSRYQGAVMEELQKMASEAYLAKQLGAFQVDLDTRKSWLKKSTAPSQFVQQIEEKTKESLETWRQDVLDTQADLVGRFFRRNALVAMGRPVSGKDANAARKEVLMQGGMLWRATVESMTLAAKRWNRMVPDPEVRRQQMEQLGSRAVEMYALLGMLDQFNASAGADSQSALLVGDFADMLDAVESLGTPFTKALYARDAEVVTATSLDPLNDNESLLNERYQDAKRAVKNAKNNIASLIKEMQAEALKEAEIRGKLERKMSESATRIASLCGLPEGCTAQNLSANPEKCLKVRSGSCGLHSPGNPEVNATFDPSKVKTSKAGQEILDVLEAYKNLDLAGSDLDGHLQKAKLELKELEAFQRDVESWNEKRQEGVKALQANLAKQDNLKDQQLKTLIGNLKKRAAARQSTIDRMREEHKKWNQIRVDGAQSSFQSELAELGLRRSAEATERTGEFAADMLEAAAEGLPDVVGTSTDPSAPAQMALYAAGASAEYAGDMAAIGLNAQADRVAAERAKSSALTEAKLERLQERSDLKDEIGDAQMAKLKDRMEKVDTLTDNQISQLENTLRLAKAQREAHLAYERDLAELRERRKEYQKMLIDTSGLRMKRERAAFRVLQRMMEYRQVVQKAQLEAARYREMQVQMSNLNSLLGGPSVIFLRFQELRSAERHLVEAREALMDWLVVMEYYAVRPFIAERIQIMMARNPYQLSSILSSLEDIQENCGGSERSNQTVNVSLRDDLMNLDRPQQGLEGELSVGDRFRQSLQSGYVPVDRQIRFSTSSSLNDVLERENGVLATTFSLRLDKFANLSNACNAKLDSMSIQLSGDIGKGQPSVSLLYDGSAQLRSCQPNVDEVVNSFSPGLTSYGTTTYLDAAGRSATPVASINKFPDKNSGENRTLAGLPLASQYTVLIDTTQANNRDLDWSKLEDIKLQLEYTYQDLFPEACN